MPQTLPPLVSTDWLAERLADPSLRILELRGAVLPPSEPPPHYITDRAGYLAAHIPQAQFLDWQVDIVQPGSPSNDIAAPERFAALMGRLGIDSSHTVVLADNAAGMFAGRMRWALRYYGHERVCIVDGGWQKWLAEGKPTSTDLPQFPATAFPIRVNERLRATAAQIAASLDTHSLQLLDVRSPAEFAGESSRARSRGHIPGATNLPRSRLLAADGTLKPTHELRALFAQIQLDLDAPTVLYCNSGVSATVGMLALEQAGARDLAVYDGSWKEWGNEPALPKVNPAHGSGEKGS